MHRPRPPPGDLGFPGRQALRRATVMSVLAAPSRAAPPARGHSCPPNAPSLFFFPVTAFGERVFRCQAASPLGEILYLNWMKFELEVMLFNKNVWF